MLDMFFTTAGIGMQFPQQKLCQFDFSIPAKILEIYSTVFLYPVFWGKESSWTYREYFVLILKLSADNLVLHYL